MQQQKQQQQSEKEQRNDNTSANQPAVTNSVVGLEQSKAIHQVNAWLDGQRSRIEAVSAASQSMEAHSVLQVVETTWAMYLQDGVLQELPEDIPAVTISNTGAGMSCRPHFIPSIRYFISITEQPVAMGLVLHGEASDLNIDWNTRLGIQNTEPNLTIWSHQKPLATSRRLRWSWSDLRLVAIKSPVHWIRRWASLSYKRPKHNRKVGLMPPSSI